jgi:hypothetical protein
MRPVGYRAKPPFVAVGESQKIIEVQVASKIKHELCVVVEKYTDREGKEKSRWQKVGVELETESGGRIILLERWFNQTIWDAIPAPKAAWVREAIEERAKKENLTTGST